MAPSLLGFRIGHRAMQGDTRRLAGMMTEIATGEQTADEVRLST